MNRARRFTFLRPLQFAACSLVLLLSACAVTGVGYAGYDGYADDGYPYYGYPYYAGGVYQPYGYGYGGWGPGYHVGPPRGRGAYAGGGGGRLRGAAPGRPIPSVPGRSRGAAPHHR